MSVSEALITGPRFISAVAEVGAPVPRSGAGGFGFAFEFAFEFGFGGRARRFRARPRRVRCRGINHRGAGRLRLPPGHRGGLADRRPGQPQRQPRTPVGTGKDRHVGGARRRAVRASFRLPGHRHAPEAVPPAHRDAHHPSVHAERGWASPGSRPNPAQDHPARFDASVTARRGTPECQTLAVVFD